MKKKVAISAIVLCLAVILVVLFKGRQQVTLEAYWNDRDNLVFERSSVREISAIIVKNKKGSFIWIVNNRTKSFSSVEYGVVPSHLGGPYVPKQSLPAHGGSPPEIKEGDVVVFSLSFRKDYFMVVPSMGSEAWSIVVPRKGEQSKGTRLFRF